MMQEEKQDDAAKGKKGTMGAAERAGHWALGGIMAAAVALAVLTTFGGGPEKLATTRVISLTIVGCWVLAVAAAVRRRKEKGGKAALAVLGILGAMGLAVLAAGMFGELPSPSEPASRPATRANNGTPPKVGRQQAAPGTWTTRPAARGLATWPAGPRSLTVAIVVPPPGDDRMYAAEGRARSLEEMRLVLEAWYAEDPLGQVRIRQGGDTKPEWAAALVEACREIGFAGGQIAVEPKDSSESRPTSRP